MIIEQIMIQISTKIVLVLEGGYNIDVMKKAVHSLLKILAGYPLVNYETWKDKNRLQQYLRPLPWFLDNCNQVLLNW